MHKCLVLGILALLTVISSHAADVPHLINYQGRLTDANGEALATREYALTFKLWDHATSAGSEHLLWTEVHGSVPVVRGSFNVVLGGISSGLGEAFNGTDRFISISVDEGEDISPRQQLLSAPYAIAAGNGVPVGVIAPFLGVSVPSGWLLCDGSTLDASVNSAHAELVAHLRALNDSGGADFRVPDDQMNENTAILPDLRGMFLRGAGANDDNDYRYESDEQHVPGTMQSHQIAAHRHEVFRHYSGPSSGSGGQASRAVTYAHPDFEVPASPLQGPNPNVTDTNVGGETRPQNVAVTYIIKY